MTASGITTKRGEAKPLLAEQLERLRLQIVANDLNKIIGRNIARARQEKGIRTQRALAKLIGDADPQVDPNNTRVSIWETGKEAPGTHYMGLLVQVLSHDVGWFYTDHDKPAETPDPFGTTPVEETQLDRIERKLDDVLRRLGPATEEETPPADDHPLPEDDDALEPKEPSELPDEEAPDEPSTGEEEADSGGA